MRLKLPDYTTEADDLGSREPLLFIHAFPLNRTLWDPQFNELSDVARVLTFDLRGFGGADPVGAESMAQLADDCNALLDAMRVNQPVTLCGLSMGGYVAFAFYRKYPERVRALVLAATRASPDSEESKANRDRLAAAVQAHGPSAAVEAMLPKMFAPRTYEARPQLVESVRAMMLSASIPGIVGALRALRDRPDSTPTLAEIKVPTLILHGPEDQLIGLAEAEKMRDGIGGARLQVLPDSGHLLNLEQPALFNDAVRDFLWSL
jgi:pimeloyl-ACP methyl ester carboxylesterase